MSVRFPIQQIRNIGIIAHIDAGKTTLTERILYYTGRTHRVGSVDDGTTVTDWMPEERERGITITAAAVTATWTDVASGEPVQVNLIDTPGHVDFTAEVQRSLRVLDGGIVVFDAVAGVEPQSETVWHQADRFHVPRLCFINKMDRPGADVSRTLRMMEQRLGARPVLMQWPLYEGGGFIGMVDLLTMQPLLYPDEPVLWPGPVAISAGDHAAASAARQGLLERVAEADEALMERYVGGGAIEVSELVAALRRATVSGALIPVFVGSALQNKGIQPLLDGVARYLPNPVEIPAAVGQHPETGDPIARPADSHGPFCGIVFKVVTDAFMGRLSYVRIYSGTLVSGARTLNTTRGCEERIARILRMHANRREDIEICLAGDIVGLLGLRQSYTGDTLSAPDAPVLLEPIEFPAPVIRMAARPAAQVDGERLVTALRKLADEDPTFTVAYDDQTRQTVISGMGELHLEIIVERARREFGVACIVEAPQAAYQETITGLARAEGRYVHQSGGAGRFGIVELEILPAEPGSGLRFDSRVSSIVLPDTYVAGVEKGVREASARGILAGFPVTDIRVRVIGGRYHEVDSHRMDFEIAGSIALKEALRRAGAVLLEPIMQVEASAPISFVGGLVKDFAARRGQVGMMDQIGDIYLVHADVPLSEMFGYITALRDMTSGRGTFTMEFTRYAQVPDAIARAIVAARTQAAGSSSVGTRS